MKSTQDLAIWLNSVASELKVPMLEISVFTDKSFRVIKHDPLAIADPEIVYDSDIMDEQLDINDICYTDPAKFAQDIIELNTIRAEEL